MITSIGLLLFGTIAFAAQPSSAGACKWISAGRELAAKDADKLEGRVKSKPVDFAPLVKLLARRTHQATEADRPFRRGPGPRDPDARESVRQREYDITRLNGNLYYAVTQLGVHFTLGQ